VKKAAEAKAAEEVKKAEEAQKAAAAKAAEEARKAEEAKKAAEAQKAAEPEGCTRTCLVGVAALARETTTVAERGAKVPKDHYSIAYNGAIREVSLGNEPKTVTVGGTNAMPFYLFEGKMPTSPSLHGCARRAAR